jgi:hypothetical protein
VIRSKLGTPCRVRCREAMRDLTLDAGESYVWNGE